MVVDSTAMLINGLQTEFLGTYRDVTNRQSDSRLGMVMDLSRVNIDNRNKDFAYRESAPHMDEWIEGEDIPSEGMASVSYPGVVHKWGKRLKWPESDREDDQTGGLMDDAARLGTSVGLMNERFFFDLLLGTTTTLPAVPNAPDGLPFFSSSTRFGNSNGNIVSGFAVTGPDTVLTGFYSAITRFRDFQDTKGQPLWTPDVVDAGTVVIHSSQDEKVFEEAFSQQRQITQAAVGATPSNVVIDANRNVTLWSTSRIPTGSAYVFLRETPVQSTAVVSRRGVRERSSLGNENNGDYTRTTGMEYVQWDLRRGAMINLPYGAIQLTA